MRPKMTKLQNQQDAENFLHKKGLRVGEDVVRAVVTVQPHIIAGEKGFSRRKIYHGPQGICSKSTFAKIKKYINAEH